MLRNFLERRATARRSRLVGSHYSTTESRSWLQAVLAHLSPSGLLHTYHSLAIGRGSKLSALYLIFCAGGFVWAFVLVSRHIRRRLWERARRQRLAPLGLRRDHHSQDDGDHIYDVCVVGAGPAGATAAFYLAEAGHSVLLLDSNRFPRDAGCGDRVAPNAQAHLKRMGVLQELLQKRECRWAQSGGFVSPGGRSFLAQMDTVMGERLMAVQRIILDAKLAQAAVRAGARLLEGHEVKGAEFHQPQGYWVVRLSLCDLEGENYTYRARMLVAADGAESALARSLGVVQTTPGAYACRSFAKAGTHAFPDADHVVFYPSRLKSGYVVVFHELEDFLNLTCYFFPREKPILLPGDVLQLRRAYEDVLASDPDLLRALGPDVEITDPQFFPVRFGGVPRSYADHFVVVGAAAGLVDPLSGAGLHYAMDSAKMASAVICEGFKSGDLSSRTLARYQRRWQAAFGRDLWVAGVILRLLQRFPRLLDAAAAVIQSRGTSFVETWAMAMMGGRSKMWFLMPRNLVPILSHAVWLWLTRSRRDADRPSFV